tara:strand:- start:29148 stop:29438 length:291 start_codon:yes stop_codon:yes gene_type:complete
MTELTQEQKKQLVLEINRFEASNLGRYVLDEWKKLYDNNVDFAIDTPTNQEFTIDAREGLLGECRQLKVCLNTFSRLREDLVSEIKETETNKETNQ